MKTRYWLLIILFIAIIVRFASISSESVWVDEAFSAYHGQQSFEHILTLDDTNLPIYLLPIKLTSYVSINEFWLRLPSLIFGVLSVFAIFLLAKKLFNEKVGLISAFILSISTHHIYYSQEARVYSLLTLLSILSMYYFLKIKETKWQYILTTLLMIYSHFFGLLTLLVQNIYYLIKKPIKISKWFLVQSVMFILYIPGLIHLYNQVTTAGKNFWITKELALGIIHLHTIFSGGIILSGIYLTLFLISYYIGKRNRQSLLLPTLWIFVSLGIPVLVSIFKPLVVPRYLIFISIPFYILVAYSLSKMKKKWLIALLVLIIAVSIFYIYVQQTTFEKENWREITEYSNELNADITIIEPGFGIMSYAYYTKTCFNDTNVFNCTRRYGIFGIWKKNKTFEEEHINYGDKIEYIARDIGDNDSKTEYFNYLNQSLILESSKEFPIEYGGKITTYFFTK